MELDFKTYGYLLLACMLTVSACTSPKVPHSAYVDGMITVADSVDSSGDYSGINVTIIKKDSAQAEADTLFHQTTDKDGHFAGMARFLESRFYTMMVSRNQRRLGQTSVILAANDTVHIEGVLPNLQNSIKIVSEEHNALERYRRLNRGYQRVSRYIQSGALRGDSLVNEIDKWANLYWDLFEKENGTIASRMSAVEAIRLYGAIDGKKMMDKLRQVYDNDELASVAAQYGKEYLAKNKGLEYTLNYLDTLQTITDDTLVNMSIRQERIKLLYDSARIIQAKDQLAAFKKEYTLTPSTRNWVESIEYDLTYLSPGDTIPSFSFSDNDKTISRESLRGTPYILEVTLLSNKLYQNQYDRTFVIHNIYKNFGLQVVTIPLDQNQVTIDAFFQERNRVWPVASADDFERKEVIEKFNIRLVPTRFLVDKNGKIVRKYIGQEYQDVIQGIQTLINTEEEEPTS